MIDEQLAQLVAIDADEVWRRLDAEAEDLSDTLDVAKQVAEVNGVITKKERAVISAIEDRYRRL